MRTICILFLVFGVFLLACNGGNGTNGNGGPYDLTGTATLENQEEHSGVGVEILEADTFVLTDEAGHYELPPLPDGDYTLNFVFPYYGNERCTITVESDMTSERIPDIELEQLLKFSLEINDTVFCEGDTFRFTSSATNTSSIPVIISWHEYPPWITMFFSDTTPISALIGGYHVIVNDTLFPGERDSVRTWIIVGEEGPIDSTMSGVLSFIAGIATTDIGSEIIPEKDIYFPSSISFGTDIIVNHIYKKLPRKFFRVE